MQNGDELTGGAARSGQAASFADKAWTSLATTAGMFLAPGVYWALDTYGPSSRVLFLEYFPFLATLHTVLATAIGAWLGTRAFHLLRPQISYSAVRLTVGCLTGGVLGFVAGVVLAVASLFVAGIQAGDALTIAIVAFAVGVSAFAAWLCGIALFKSKEHVQKKGVLAGSSPRASRRLSLCGSSCLSSPRSRAAAAWRIAKRGRGCICANSVP